MTLKHGSNVAGREHWREESVEGDEIMKIFFDSKVKSSFPLWKITLVPGENTVADKIGAELLDAHASDCKISGDKPRLRKIDEPKTGAKPKPISVVTSATSSPKADSKKGVR